MTKIILSVLVLGLGAMAEKSGGTLNVNCKPASMSGGVSVALKGTVELIISESTGAIKAKSGSKLTLTLNGQSQVIPFQGTFHTKKIFKGTMDSDGPRPVTEIIIDSTDKPFSEASTVEFPNGKKAFMNCGKHQ